MEEKITSRLFLCGLVATLLTAVCLTFMFRHTFDNHLSSQIRQNVDLVAEAYVRLEDPSELSSFAADGLRVTLVSPSGQVLFESTGASELDNHLDRPEITAALNEGYGAARRHSDTLSEQVYYAAKRMPDGNVLRVAMEVGGLYSQFYNMYPWMIGMLLILILLSIIFAIFLTRKLLRPVHLIADHLQHPRDIDIDSVDRELQPFVRELQLQHELSDHRFADLTEQKNTLQAVIEHMSEGLLFYTPDGQIRLANASAERLLRQTEPLLGKDAFSIAPLCDCLPQDNAPARSELECGGRRLQIMSGPVIDQDGKQGGTVCLLLDITEKSQIERMKAEFTANVTHELKTPLTSISGYAELIEAGMTAPEDTKKFAGVIRKESARLLSLIGDILKLSSLESGELATEFEPVNLLELLQETADRLRLSAEKRQVTLRVTGYPCTVKADRELISELAYNLCDNAIRYNRPGGLVELNACDKTLTVSDNGIGIPNSHLPRIFERFYRVDKSRSKETGGTGLGLAIVKYIAERHGATLDLTSREGEGTTVKVIFPA